MNAKVILSKCPRSKDLFGMRIEERNNDWVRTWAFKITEIKAKHEGYDKTKKTGTMQPLPEYPGCPYCGSNNIAQCSCGKLFCWINETSTAVCPWCGQKGEYHTVETIDVEGSGL